MGVRRKMQHLGVGGDRARLFGQARNYWKNTKIVLLHTATCPNPAPELQARADVALLLWSEIRA